MLHPEDRKYTGAQSWILDRHERHIAGYESAVAVSSYLLGRMSLLHPAPGMDIPGDRMSLLGLILAWVTYRKRHPKIKNKDS